MSLLIKLIGEERLSAIYRTYASKQVKTGMSAEFQDDKGRWYYSFLDEGDVPVARLAESHTHMQYMAAGLSPEVWKEAYEKMTALYAKGEFVKAGVILNDLTDLEKKIVNLDALINIIAVNYVREDEDAVTVNQSIHLDKCNFLKTETEEGRFFFRLPMFAKLLNKAILSKEDAEQFYQDYLQRKLKLMKRWSTLASKEFQNELTKKD